MPPEDIRTDSPPPILYHYTSQEGLVGIVKSRNLWASKIHYMNDAREFSAALDLARDEVTSRLKREKDPSRKAQLKSCLTETDSIAGVNICVCSFSEVGDSLSQWRAYTGHGAGFSIGFSTQQLLKIAATQGFSLRKCIYDEHKQRILVNELLDKVLLSEKPAVPELMDYEVLAHVGDFVQALARIAPLLKDNSFSDEREWRLISRPIFFQDLDHRPGRSMITPFFNLSLEIDGKFSCLSEIVVGPTPHPELSKASVESLLWTVQKTVVKLTNVPFRNW